MNKDKYVFSQITSLLDRSLFNDYVRKLSESKTAKGQLIFTTHESGLLDQSIFRPDEIWFAQKDAEQATQLYPLSDYNIHHTANISLILSSLTIFGADFPASTNTFLPLR